MDDKLLKRRVTHIGYLVSAMLRRSKPGQFIRLFLENNDGAVVESTRLLIEDPEEEKRLIKELKKLERSRRGKIE